MNLQAAPLCSNREKHLLSLLQPETFCAACVGLNGKVLDTWVFYFSDYGKEVKIITLKVKTCIY